MSTHYRERREAGVYSADEAEREKAGAKYDKQWNKQMEAEEQRVAEEQGTPGTAAK